MLAKGIYQVKFEGNILNETRKLIIEDTTDKRVGLPYVLISGTQEKRWSQLHIENNNMHIYCYEHKERVNTIRRKNEFYTCVCNSFSN